MLKKNKADLERIFDKIQANMIKKDLFCQAIQNTISEEVERQTGKKQTYEVDGESNSKELEINLTGGING
jgi:hypothetical protein